MQRGKSDRVRTSILQPLQPEDLAHGTDMPRAQTLGQSGKPNVFFQRRFPFTLSATLHIPAKFKPQWFGILTGVLRITIQNDYLKTFLKTQNAESCSNIYQLCHHLPTPHQRSSLLNPDPPWPLHGGKSDKLHWYLNRKLISATLGCNHYWGLLPRIFKILSD